MRTQRRVFEKLSETTKVELSAERVELSVASDLKILVNALNAQLSIDDRILPESQRFVSELSSTLPKAKERAKTNKSVINATDGKIDLAEDALSKAKNIAKELGIKTNQIENFSQVEKLLKDVIKNRRAIENLTERLNDLLK